MTAVPGNDLRKIQRDGLRILESAHPEMLETS